MIDAFLIQLFWLLAPLQNIQNALFVKDCPLVIVRHVHWSLSDIWHFCFHMLMEYIILKINRCDPREVILVCIGLSTLGAGSNRDVIYVPYNSTYKKINIDKFNIKWFIAWHYQNHTVMILSFRTDMSGQTVQTQIRLLLEEQSDQGLHCLPLCLYSLDSLLCGRAT